MWSVFWSSSVWQRVSVVALKRWTVTIHHWPEAFYPVCNSYLQSYAREWPCTVRRHWEKIPLRLDVCIVSTDCINDDRRYTVVMLVITNIVAFAQKTNIKESIRKRPYWLLPKRHTVLNSLCAARRPGSLGFASWRHARLNGQVYYSVFSNCIVRRFRLVS